MATSSPQVYLFNLICLNSHHPIIRESLDSTTSIMLTAYPTPVSEWFSPEHEEDMTVITSMIHAARYLFISY